MAGRGWHQRDQQTAEREAQREDGREQRRIGKAQPGDGKHRPGDASITPLCQPVGYPKEEPENQREAHDPREAEVGERIRPDVAVCVRALGEVGRADHERNVLAVGAQTAHLRKLCESPYGW